MIVNENSYEVCITLPAGEGLEAGMLCTMEGDGTVIPVQAGCRPLGVAKTVRNGIAGVQVCGVIRANLAEEIYGRTRLCMGEDNLMECDDSYGVPALVLGKNADGTYSIML